MARNAPPASNNALTPSFASVSSATGFSSGDLVYSKDSNFTLVAGNAVTSANFPISTTTAKSAFPNANGAIKQATPTGGGVYYHGRSAATLANGNIVIVSATPAEAYPFFRIIDENNNEIVAKTPIGGWGSYQARFGTMDVCALTGGNFLITWWDNNTGSPFYSFRDSTGGELARFNDGSNCDGPITSASMPNGNVIVCWTYKAGSTGFFKVMDPVGNTVVSVTAVGANPVNTNTPLVPGVRSDNTFVICMATSSTTIVCRRFSATGVFAATVNIATNLNGTSYLGYSVCVNSTNVVYCLYSASTSFINFGQLSAANAVSPNNSLSNPIGATCPAVLTTSGGNIALIYNDISSGYLRFELRNSSLARVGAVSYNVGHPQGMLPDSLRSCIVETANYFSFFTSVIGGTNGSNDKAPLSHIYSQMNKTTPYAVRNTSSLSVGVGNVSASVSGYARSNSTPNAASFLAATTQTLTLNQTQSSGPSSWLVNPTICDSASNSLSMTMMQNGQFVVAYTLQTTGQVKFAVYSSAGVLQNTYVVAATSANTVSGANPDGCIRCCTLPNGKLVIAYPSSSSVLAFAIYSSSYSLLTTFTYTGVAAQSLNTTGNYGFSLSALGYPSNRFVFAFNRSSTQQTLWAVYDDTGIQMGGAITGNNGCNNAQVYGLPNGAFFVTTTYTAGANIQVLSVIPNYDSTSYVEYNLYNGTNSGAPYANTGAASPAGTGAILVRDSAPSLIVSFRFGSMVASYATDGANVPESPANAGGVGVLADGTFVYYCYTYGGQYFVSNFTPNVYNQGGSTVQFNSLSTPYQNSVPSSGPLGVNMKIIGLYDNVAAFAYFDSSYNVNVGLLSVGTASYTGNITAGVTASNVAFYPSPSNGYYLAGVSASNCSAGGTGVIQTNGAATLNSQYPATTTSQAFDFTTLTISGVRGTIAGRNLVLKGS